VDFYEELAVSRTASTEEIHRSYKRLARLFHPDRQADPEMRAAAELQMRRLNQILAVLTDPRERLRYDFILAGGTRPPVPPSFAKPRSRTLLRFDLNSAFWFALGAILVGALAAVVSTSEPPQAPLAEAVHPEPAPPSADPAKADSLESRIDEFRRRYPAETHATTAPVEGTGERRQTAKRLAAVHPPQPPPLAAPAPAAAPSLPAPPAIGAGETKPAPLPLEIRPAPVQVGLPGLWRYMQTSRVTQKPGAFAAERAEVAITEEAGVLYGYYTARYAVPDRHLSPDVNFQFSGAPDPGVTRLSWHGMNGNRGEISLRVLSSNALEVNWVTTHAEHRGYLASGKITLSRVTE